MYIFSNDSKPRSANEVVLVMNAACVTGPYKGELNPGSELPDEVDISSTLRMKA